jgi:hypothetical protein
MIHAVNKDELQQMIDDGETMDDEQKAIWKEFEEKEKLLQTGH